MDCNFRRQLRSPLTWLLGSLKSTQDSCPALPIPSPTLVGRIGEGQLAL